MEILCVSLIFDGKSKIQLMKIYELGMWNCVHLSPTNYCLVSRFSAFETAICDDDSVDLSARWKADTKSEAQPHKMRSNIGILITNYKS